MLLTILGNAAGGPYHGRPYSAQVLQVDQHLFLIDCGEGTQMQLFDHGIRYDRCNEIFISHLHGDHVFGLMGLITNWCLKKRAATLQIFSPPGVRELVESTCRICGVRVPYPIEFHEVDAAASVKVFENQKVEVWTIPLAHRIATSGWLFREKTRPRTMRADMIEAYGIPYVLIPGIKTGDDLHLSDGRVIPNTELTTPPPAPLAYAFCSDTAPSAAVAEVVSGVDLLYHEATFTEEHTTEAAISFHSTAAQAAAIAVQAGVGWLLLGHFSGRYMDTAQHLAEARMVFESTAAAEPGMRIDVGKKEAMVMAKKLEKKISAGENDIPKESTGQRFVQFSKLLSRVLRHHPRMLGLQLDANGWAEVSALLEGAAARGFADLDYPTLQQVVATNSKQRFALSADGRRIRANQGHSMAIDLGLAPQIPPDTLYHGTAEKSLEAIRNSGLKPMQRQHVHLSPDVTTAQSVGGRHGKAVVLTIRSGDMAAQGHLFFQSENGVWLVAEVPVDFIGFPASVL